MANGRFLKVSEQVAAHLRQEILRRRWVNTIPGLPKLAVELEVNVKTVETALRLLEAEGLLIARGAGRTREIRLPENVPSAALRITILDYSPNSRDRPYTIKLEQRLLEAGHQPLHSKLSQTEIAFSMKRLAKVIQKTETDAWIVCSAPEHILQYFSEQSIPAFALFGKHLDVPLPAAGPNKLPAYSKATRALIELGHRRIVLLARSVRRSPSPGLSEKAFLNELAAADLKVGDFNLPEWKETVEGLRHCITSLFKVTPPTAIIVDEVPLFLAVQQSLMNLQKRVPEDVSMICTDYDSVFEWCTPSIAHIAWDMEPIMRRIVAWANGISIGKKPDHEHFSVPAEFVSGGTIGPVRA